MQGVANASEYVLGQVVRMSLEASVEGVLTNPSGLTCTVLKPDASLVILTPTNDGVGDFHADFTTDQIGPHHYRFQGGGAAAGAGEDAFRVISAF